MKKVFIVIFILLIVSALIGVELFGNKSPNKQDNLITSYPESNPVAIEYSTFRNDKFNLQFRYNKTFEVSQIEASQGQRIEVTITSPDFKLVIWKGLYEANGKDVALAVNSEIVTIDGREFVFPNDIHRNIEGHIYHRTIDLVYEKYSNNDLFLAKTYNSFTINGSSYYLDLETSPLGDDEKTKQVLIDIIKSINF